MAALVRRRLRHLAGRHRADGRVALDWLGRSGVAVVAVCALIAMLAVGLTSSTTGSDRAAAAPGNPGTPSAPKAVYTEDFENGSGVTTLPDYQSTSGVKYTADPYWLDTSQCNGFVLSYSDTAQPNGYCQSFGGTPDYFATRVKAQALGTLNDPQNPDTNRALSTNTSPRTANGTSPPNEIEFETAGQIPLSSATSRFITFGVDAASTSCGQGAPLLRFYLRNDAGTEIPVSTSAINPCTDPGTQTSPDGLVHYGRFPANSSTLVTGNSVGIVLRNESSQAAQGNDGAIDNIQVLDATPQLDKAFTPASIETGGTSTLTFTVTNTSELAAKNGWSFTDKLPAGLVVANPANTATTCPAGAVTPAADGTSIAGTGNLNAGQASCTLTVDVTSSTIGEHTNGPDNVTATGLTPPGTSTLTVTPPTVTCTTDPNIFSTGANGMGGIKANGTNDAHWGVAPKNDDGFNAPNGLPNLTDPASQAAPPPAGAVFEPAEVGKVNPAWSDSPYGNNAQWISADYAPGGMNQNGPPTGGQRGDWYYRYQFDLADEVDPATFALAVNFLADNTVYEVYVNGVPQSPNNAGQLPQPSAGTVDPYGAAGDGSGAGYLNANAANLTLKSDWKTGLNTIDVQVKSANPAEGFDAQVRPSQLCPTMTVTKNVNGRVAADDQFTVGIENAGGDSLASASTTGTDNTVSTKPTVLRSGSTYTITDAMAAGSTSKISHYDSTIVCTDTTTGDAVTTTGTGPTWKVTTPNPDNYTCVITNVSRGYSVTKTTDATGPVRPGDTVTYTVTVANTGQTAYSADRPAVFEDDLSKVLDDATYNNDGAASAGTVTYAKPTLSWSGPLAVGASDTITYSVKVKAPDTGDKKLVNAITIPPPPGTPQGTPPDGACITCTTTTPVLSFEVTKTASTAQLVPGQKVTYTVTVKNTGGAAFTAADPASFTDDLSGLLDDSMYNNDQAATGGTVTYAEPTLSWSGALEVGQTITVTYSVTVNDPDTGDLKMTNAVVTPPGIGNCPTGSNDPRCTVTVPGGKLQIKKTSSKQNASPGDKVTYTVTVKNIGQTDFAPAKITDDLSGVLDDATYSKDGSKGVSVDGHTLTWTGPIKIGATATFTYSVTVNDPDKGDGQLKNVITPPPGITTNCPGDDCRTDTPVRSYHVDKKASQDSVRVGDTVDYTVTVTNTGKNPYTTADPAKFTDDLSEVLDDASYNKDAKASAGTTSYAKPKLSWSGALPTGGKVTVTYSVTVNDPASGDGKLHNVVTTPPGTGGGGGDPANCTSGSDLGPECQTQTGIEAATANDEPSSNGGSSNSGSTASTGNNTEIELLVGLMALLAGAAACVAGMRRRRA